MQSNGCDKDCVSDYVKLNVGGSLFYTTIGTLTRHGTMFKAMFSGQMRNKVDDEGWVMIDRCGLHFNSILSFLRDDRVALPDNPQGIAELLAEAEYYLITPLIDVCQQALRLKQYNIESQCCSLVLNDSKSFDCLLMSNPKPIVQLRINIKNNIHPYTRCSNENIIRHYELFDSLSLRFGSKFLFIKYINCSSKICCWNFFVKSNETSEICCTSIVEADYEPKIGKKRTKVNFPLANIYEECLNLLFKEDITKPTIESSKGD